MTLQTYSKEEIDRLTAALEQWKAEAKRLTLEGLKLSNANIDCKLRIELLEAAMIETDNRNIFCLACHNQAYTGEKIQHRKDCLLFPRR